MDIEHDAQLELRGVPVLRRDFVHVVHEMPATIELLLRRLAVAQSTQGSPRDHPP